MVILERPKIAPHREAMRLAIADATGLPAGRVSVKATTNEGLGSLGAGDGVAAYAVATVQESGQNT
jgi:2-C-methyl-D-erythritol 4-phosphate cytidylyltransferase/2-C-methyl-D-erythritol 2,4-cyclodiphosphate synthase